MTPLHGVLDDGTSFIPISARGAGIHISHKMMSIISQYQKLTHNSISGEKFLSWPTVRMERFI